MNALLGDELLPIANTPETARIVRVRHANVEVPVLHDGGKVAEGKADIQDYLRKRNERARQPGKHNDRVLDLDAPLAVLKGQPLGDYGFEILDTPGPNEAGAEHLATAVDRLIASADVVLYLLDYTKLKTNDEERLLKRLKASRGDLLDRVHDRLFFLVNKIDAEDRNGLSQSETCDYVANSLEQHLGVTIPKDRILLLSASRALLARLVQSGHPSDKALEDFRGLVFGLFQDQERSDEELTAAASSLLASSKVETVEARTVDYLYQHRGQILFETTLESLDRHVQSFKGHLVTAKGASSADQGKLKGDISQLETDLETVQANLAEVEKEAGRFRDALKGSVASEIEDFKAKVKGYIRRQFEGIRKAQKKSLDPVGEALRKAFTGTTSQHAAQDRLRDLNDKMLGYVRGRAESYRTRLETAGQSEQEKLYGKIQDQVNEMSRLIEARVGRALDVDLPQTRFSVSLPSESKIRENLQKRVSTFIETREGEITQEGGVCRKEKRADDTYVPSETGVRDYWLEQIDDIADVFESAADALIEGEIQDAVNAARHHIKTHATGALRTIRREMETAQASEQDHQSRLAALDKRLDDAERLEEVRQRALGFVAQVPA